MDDATASDNCGDVSIDVESETIAGDALATTRCSHVHCDGRLWQQHFCDQTITVEDTTAPELSIPEDYTSAECSDELRSLGGEHQHLTTAVR